MLVLALGIGGCTALSGDGPWSGAPQSTRTESLPFDVIDLTPTTVAAYRLPSVDRPSTSTADLSPAVPISIGPGDVLRVRIFERYGGNIFPTLNSQGGADLGVQRVGEDGTITLPFVGTVPVAGLDLTQAQQRIKARVNASNKVQDPEVIVDFDAPRAHTVVVSGEVRKPGRISLLEGVRTVIDAINMAGGPAIATGTPAPSNQVEVIVRRNGQVILTSQLSDL